MALIEVKVTDAHIRKGDRESAKTCPVAMALTDATGESWDVDPISAFSWSLGPYTTVRLPLSVCKWIRRFDKGRPVEPFKFQIELPIPKCGLDYPENMSERTHDE